MKIKSISIIFCLVVLCLPASGSKSSAVNKTLEGTTSVDGFCFLSVEETPPEQTSGGATCGGFTITRSGCTDGTPDCTVQAVYCQLGNQIQVNLASTCGW